MLAAAAAERLSGEPLWLLIISGPAMRRPKRCKHSAASGAICVSTIASEGALLSASPKRERSKDATGGLLRQIGTHGILVVKDMTSILSMQSNTRAPMLSALREIHDGKWVRTVGTDGGKTMAWAGRIVVDRGVHDGVGYAPYRDCRDGGSLRPGADELPSRTRLRRASGD